MAQSHIDLVVHVLVDVQKQRGGAPVPVRELADYLPQNYSTVYNYLSQAILDGRVHKNGKTGFSANLNQFTYCPMCKHKI